MLHDPDFFLDKDADSCVVTPDPARADEIRETLQRKGATRASVITMSLFLKRMTKTLGTTAPSRKSELLPVLARAWSKTGLPSDFGLFLRNFEIFTDLAGLCSSDRVFTDLLDEFPRETRAIVTLFRETLREKELVDEHGAWGRLTEKLEESQGQVHGIPDKLILWGFSFVSGTQIDFLKALARFADIVVLFPEKVFDKAGIEDWPLRLETSTVPSRTKDMSNSPTPEIVLFPKGRASEFFLGWVCGQRGEENELEIFLSGMNPTFDECNAIPIDGFFFKISDGFFQEKAGRIARDLREKFFSGTNRPDVAGITVYISKQIEQELGKGEKADLPSVKALSLFYSAFMDKQYSPGELIHPFDFQVIAYCVSLDCPRLHLMPVLKENHPHKISGLESLRSLGTSQRPIIFAFPDDSFSKGGTGPYSPALIDIMAKFGPVKRPDLEEAIFRERARDLLAKSGAVLFIEETLLEHDPFWASVLERDQIPEAKVEQVRKVYVPKDLIAERLPLPGQISSISQSGLHDYSLCPRLYYAKHQAKLDTGRSLAYDIDKRERGTLEHAIIKDYCEKQQIFSPSTHEKTARALFDDYLKRQGKQVHPTVAREAFLEILHFSGNGIRFIFDLKKTHLIKKIEFETPVTDERDGFIFRGRQDVIAWAEDKIFLMDFKRNLSTRNQAAIENCDDMQLWFYLLHGKIPPEKIGLMGYFILSEPEDSLLFSEDDKSPALRLNVSFEEGLRRYTQRESEILTRFKKNDFAPDPREKSACKYCPVKALCHERILSGGVA
jgi:RecB family exonuclease